MGSNICILKIYYSNDIVSLQYNCNNTFKNLRETLKIDNTSMFLYNGWLVTNENQKIYNVIYNNLLLSSNKIVLRIVKTLYIEKNNKKYFYVKCNTCQNEYLKEERDINIPYLGTNTYLTNPKRYHHVSCNESLVKEKYASKEYNINRNINTNVKNTQGENDSDDMVII